MKKKQWQTWCGGRIKKEIIVSFKETKGFPTKHKYTFGREVQLSWFKVIITIMLEFL